MRRDKGATASCAAGWLVGWLAVSLGLAFSVAWPARAETWAGGDLTLEQCLQLGLERNLGYANARLSVDAAAAAVRQAAGRLAPQVTVGGNASRLAWEEEAGPVVSISAAQTYTGLWPALNVAGWERPLGPVALAQLNEAQAGASRERVRMQLIYDITQAYFKVLEAQRLREVREAALTAAEAAWSATTAKLNAGTATRLDLLQAELSVAQAELALAKAKDACLSAERTLFALLRLDAPAGPVNYAPAPPAALPAGTLEELAAQALERRPEVREATLAVEKAASAYHQARLDTLPTLSLYGSYEDEHFSASSGWNPLTGTVNWTATATTGSTSAARTLLGSEWDVGIKITYPLLDQGTLAEAVLQARLQLQQAENSLEQQKNAVLAEVRATWLELEEARLSVAAAERALALSAEAQRLARLRVDNGVGTPAELLEANADYLAAQVDLVQAQFAEQLAAVKLRKAVGLL